MKLCLPENCTGCLVCVNVCPCQALRISRDAEGFYIPVVNKEVCTDCKLCEIKCPVLHPIEQGRTGQYGYASWIKDTFIRRHSSSGGVFSALSQTILDRDGLVVGAVLDEGREVRHIAIQSKDELNYLRGSKYVQSYLGYIYQDVKNYLLSGRHVLFTGTPCQIAGLYAFLGKNYPNLYTADMICHGVPSPEIFRKYIGWLENRYHSKVREYFFRDKRKSWCWFNTKAVFESGEIYIGSWFKDPFMRIFLRDYILRPCCYNCNYTNMQRMGDITIADFWGYKAKTNRERDTDDGISLVIINSGKGEELFNDTKYQLFYSVRSYDEIQNTQKSLSMPWKMPDKRADFWKDSERLSFDELIKRYGYPEKRTIAQYLVSEFGKTLMIRIVLGLGVRVKRLIFKVIDKKK